MNHYPWLDLTARTNAAVQEILADPRTAAYDVLDWSDLISNAIDAAKDALPEGAAPAVAHVYALSATLIQHLLLPAMQTSPHPVLAAYPPIFETDLHHIRWATRPSELPEPIIRVSAPPPHHPSPSDWAERAAAIAEWLTDRAEVHAPTLEALAANTGIDPAAPTQILMNCYSCAVAIAATAWGWADALPAPPAAP